MRLLIANWKMAPESAVQTKMLARATSVTARAHKKNIKLIVCPSFIHMSSFRTVAKTIALGGQDVSSFTAASSTGQTSASMLKSYGATHCIVGHSECRSNGDSNTIVKSKIDLLLEKKIQPILCVGEKSRDAQGWYLSEIKDQIESAFFEVPKVSAKKFIIAYEPVWAIGEKALRGATAAECLEMIIYIRKLMTDLYDEKTGKSVDIIYGGSVNAENAASFITEGEAAGLLVGRASLVPKQFEELARAIDF